MSQGNYRKLLVWQKAMDLTVVTHKISDQLPTALQSGLSDQMRRSSLSIPSNIAEGKYRVSTKENRQFFRIAYASCAELETQLTVVERLNAAKTGDLKNAIDLCEEVLKMLNAMLRSGAKS